MYFRFWATFCFKAMLQQKRRNRASWRSLARHPLVSTSMKRHFVWATMGKGFLFSSNSSGTPKKAGGVKKLIRDWRPFLWMP